MQMRAVVPLVALLGLLGLGVGCDSGDGPEATREETILALEGDSAAGGSTFSGGCSLDGCHSMAATSTPLGPLVPMRTSEQILDVLVNGGATMPAQAGLSDKELADVLAYVEETFGN